MNKITRNTGIIAILFLFACSGPTESINSNADITGVITNIYNNSNQLGILVEENPSVTDPDKKGGKKLLLYLSQKTELYRKVNSKLIKLTSNDLKDGMKVKAWAGKLFLESYPAQTDAIKIIVLDE